MKILNKLLYFLSTKDRRYLFFLTLMILVMALLDTIGIASIMPFIAVLANPEIIETNVLLNKVFKISGIFGVETNRQFLFFLGVFFITMLVTSLTFKALTIYIQLRFTSRCQYKISKRFMENYLYQPYSWFLDRHSADLSKTILSEVSVLVGKGLKPMISLITQSAVAFALIIMLSIVNIKIALITSFSFGLAYFLVYKFFRSFLIKIGEGRLKANKSRFTSAMESFGAFKEIKIGGLEKIFINRFSKQAKAFAKYQASGQTISLLPRFAFEAIAFGGILSVMLYFINQDLSINEILPLISLYVFAGYRMMPALQQIYNNIAQLRLAIPSIDALYKDLNSLDSYTPNQIRGELSLKKVLTLSNINYQYPNSSKTTLKNISLSIPAYSTIGFAGVTGSGKTTIVDIILGLLEPQQGTIEVDGKVINKLNLRAWQQSIGYVPQQIYLADDTVTANIAYGVELENINQEAVERAAKIAKLHEFVINELPLKYQTSLGERGIKLSGGQRQRIGIARALYHNPKLLIVDEGTSALDNLTEKSLMEKVENLDNITVILIAHRLNTMRKCDIIYILEEGKIKEQGTFEKLIEVSDLFEGERASQLNNNNVISK